MSDLILISILSNLATLFIIASVILAFVVLVFTIMAIDTDVADEDDRKWAKNKAIRFFISLVICLVFATLLPNKKEVYMIYGFGSVIDYVDNNETAKELPDKVVDIVDSYLTKQDSILKSNKNEDNTK